MSTNQNSESILFDYQSWNKNKSIAQIQTTNKTSVSIKSFDLSKVIYRKLYAGE